MAAESPWALQSKETLIMSRRRRILSIAGKALAILVVLLIYAAWPGRQTFTVSPETTHVTGPLDKDGYVGGLDERLSEGITPENNANVLIWKALGPRPEGGDSMPAEYFKWLGIGQPAEQGNYFIGSSRFLRNRGEVPDSETLEQFSKKLELARVRTWKGEEMPEVAEWLKQNEKPLAVLIEATKRPDYFNPIAPIQTEDWSPGLPGALLPTLQPCRDTAQALACRAMLRLGEGRPWQ